MKQNATNQELFEKIEHGLKVAYQEMLETKAKNGQEIVVCSEDGEIRSMPASQFL